MHNGQCQCQCRWRHSSTIRTPCIDLVCVAQMSQNNTCVFSSRHFRQNAVNTRWACVWRRNKHKTNDCFLGLIFEIRKRQRFYILRRQLWEIKIWERNCQHNGEWFKRVWPTGVTFFIKKCFLYSIPSKYCFLFCFSFLVKHLFNRNRTGYTRQGKQKQNLPFRLWIFNTINTEQQMFVVNFCKQKHPFWTTELHGHGVSSANQQQKKGHLSICCVSGWSVSHAKLPTYICSIWHERQSGLERVCVCVTSDRDDDDDRERNLHTHFNTTRRAKQCQWHIAKCIRRGICMMKGCGSRSSRKRKEGR